MTPLGIVTTLAGKAQIIGSTDGVGSAARFNFPLGVVADGDQVVVVGQQNLNSGDPVTVAEERE